ncbi:MAG: hypothetical protein FWG18_03730 [Alphaproteobacteria bacterium]|nr:hypothetical protein [Alphaproteobacteria bacterium]
MNKKQLVFLSGLSGSGKGYFFDNMMPREVFYKLRSMTTRPARKGEIPGREYFFVTEDEFYITPRVTTLWVNETLCRKRDEKLSELRRKYGRFVYWIITRFYKPVPKWLYGVPVSEFKTHPNAHLVYDVIEPKYIRQMIDWTNANGNQYSPVILHFQPPAGNFDIAKRRANMQKDVYVRRVNTCNLVNFWRHNLRPDFSLMQSPDEYFIPDDLINYMNTVAKNSKSKSRFRMPSDVEWNQF